MNNASPAVCVGIPAAFGVLVPFDVANNAALFVTAEDAGKCTAIWIKKKKSRSIRTSIITFVIDATDSSGALGQQLFCASLKEMTCVVVEYPRLLHVPVGLFSAIA